MNEKNSLGLDKCFLETDEPFELFDKWYGAAKKKEINDPNALALATSSKNNVPSVRMVLLKDFSKNGFVFYTNLNSQKGNEIKQNPSVSMCFHWKSLLRQVRINGKVTPVQNTDADKYYNSRAYESRIGAWASNQSSVLNDRQELINSIDKFKEKFNEKDNVPRPDHWSGWNLKPDSFEFWLDGDNRIHERLKFLLNSDGSWKKVLLSP
jgi:pyridoxamine 5'-phosphate oxidase